MRLLRVSNIASLIALAVLWACLNPSFARATDVPQAFTLDGKLYSDAAGTTPLLDSSIGLKIQILDDGQTCVVYEENQTISTLASKGYFTVQVGTATGAPARTAGDSGNSMVTVFQNITSVSGKLFNITNNGASSTGTVARIQSNSTAGSGLTVLANGNVGVGTATPSFPLVVKSPSGTYRSGLFESTCSGCSSSITVFNGASVTGGSSAGINFAVAATADYYGTISGFANSVGNGVLNFGTVTGGAITEKMRIDQLGNVGVGTTGPRGRLDVQGGALVSSPSVSNATATVDFSASNIQHAASDCGSFQFDNMKDGGSYVFVVKGATAATCSFTAFSGASTGALTVHMPPDNGNTTASKHTIFNMIVAGSDVYVAWTPGY